MNDPAPAKIAPSHAPEWAPEWTAHFLTVSSSFVLLWLIARCCYASIEFNTDRLPELLGPFVVDQSTVQPEPAERATYFTALILVPMFMLCVHPIFWWRVAFLSPQTLWRYFLASCVAMLTLVGLGCLGDGGFYWQGCLLFSNPLVFLLVTAIGVVLSRLRLSDHLSSAVAHRVRNTRDLGLALGVALFIAATSVLRIIAVTDPYVIDNHFEAVFFTSTQVTLGSTLLVDLPHQYGLYPEFLAPIFRLCGGISVLRFTIVMAFLQAVAHALWLAGLLRVMRSPWMAMLTFLGSSSLVGFLVPLFLIRHNIIRYYDPYYQYFPVRSLFPAIAFFAMACIPSHRRFVNPVWRCLPSAILGAGILWNVDAGVPAAGSWILCLCHQAIVRQCGESRSIAAAVRAALVVAAEAMLCMAFAVFCGLALIGYKAGHWPDLELNWRFQKIFYGIGFFMLPMQLLHSWVVWAAVVMAALSVGIWPLSSMQSNHNNLSLRSTVFGWAVLACGLFSYYQGRSHDWVLPVVSPFAFVFVGIAVDRLLLASTFDSGECRTWRRACSVLTAAFVVIMASGAASPWLTHDVAWRQLQSRWRQLSAAVTDAPQPPAIVFAKQRLPSGSSALILSNHAGVYHAETQTKSALATSLIELILRRDRDDLLRRLTKTDRVFVDRSVLRVKTPNTNHETNSLIVQALSKHFVKVAESPDGYLEEWERKPDVGAGDDAIP